MAMVMLFTAWDRTGQGRPAVDTNGSLDARRSAQLFLKSEKRAANVNVFEIPAR